MPRHILHADLDAFFVAVECLRRPQLRGKPVIVGGGPYGFKRGVVSSASYEARRFGVHSGMALSRAARLCPQAIFLPVAHGIYGQYARRVIGIFKKYTPDVEQVSIDEAYLDLTGTEILHKAKAPAIAKRILCEVHDMLGLSISGGLSTSKTVSKIAASLYKPHRLVVIPPGKEAVFLAPLPIEAIPGVGKKTLPMFHKAGIRSIGDLAALTEEEVMRRFGMGMIGLWNAAQGRDDRPVESGRAEPKSMSREETFAEDIGDEKVLQKALRDMLRDVLHDLRREDVLARTIEVKIRYPDFTTVSVQRTVEPSNFEGDFLPTAYELLQKKIPPHAKVRLLGVCVKNFSHEQQLHLFPETQKKRELVSVLDTLRERHGVRVIQYGA